MSDSSPAPFSDPAGTWNSRFDSDTYLFGTTPNDWLREHAGQSTPGQRILCVADGEGRNSVWLAEQGLTVNAFDIAELGMAKAHKLAAARGVTVNYVTSDCDGYQWPEGGYDGVAAIFVQFRRPGHARAHVLEHQALSQARRHAGASGLWNRAIIS